MNENSIHSYVGRNLKLTVANCGRGCFVLMLRLSSSAASFVVAEGGLTSPLHMRVTHLYLNEAREMKLGLFAFTNLSTYAAVIGLKHGCMGVVASVPVAQTKQQRALVINKARPRLMTTIAYD